MKKICSHSGHADAALFNYRECWCFGKVSFTFQYKTHTNRFSWFEWQIEREKSVNIIWLIISVKLFTASMVFSIFSFFFHCSYNGVQCSDFRFSSLTRKSSFNFCFPAVALWISLCVSDVENPACREKTTAVIWTKRSRWFVMGYGERRSLCHCFVYLNCYNLRFDWLSSHRDAAKLQ